MLTTIFVICAVLGSTILVCQMVLTLVGLAGDSMHVDIPHDVGHDLAGGFHGDTAGHFAGHAHGHAQGGATDDAHGLAAFLKVLSFRTLVAAIAFFGIAGLGAQSAGLGSVNTMLVAVVAGAAAMYLVFWLMQSLCNLRSEGTVRMERAVGRHGTVYLRIPPQRSGAGKVMLDLQNRTVEVGAVTSGPELPTGAKIEVVDLIAPGTVEVQACADPNAGSPFAEPERETHV